MNSARVPDELRRFVRLRSSGCCEYCLLHERDLHFSFHVDHVISGKHGGVTEEHNLCYCCPDCNRAKGTDVTTLVSGRVVRLYNPRIDSWMDHFAFDGPTVRARTRIGNGTARLLAFNTSLRIELRTALFGQGSYPSEEALNLVGRNSS